MVCQRPNYRLAVVKVSHRCSAVLVGLEPR